MRICPMKSHRECQKEGQVVELIVDGKTFGLASALLAES